MTPDSRHDLTLCAVAAGVAALQPWILLALGDANVTSLEAMSGEPDVAGRMFTAMLAFMPAMFVAYWIAARHFASVRPLTVSFALYGFGLWFALELLPRSFDLLIVHGRWLPRYAEADSAARLSMEQQYSFYRDVGTALGFVRRHVLLAAQLCLAICFWRNRLLGKLLAAALALSALRLFLGSLALYAGMAWLYPIVDPMYFVTAGSIYPLLALWAFRRRNESRNSRGQTR